jgi:hypothetical protein
VFALMPHRAQQQGENHPYHWPVFMASGVFVEQKLPDGQTHARFLLPMVAKRNTKYI